MRCVVDNAERMVTLINKPQKVMIPNFVNADRTLIVTNGAGNDNKFNSHWPYRFTKCENDILEDLLEEYSAGDTMIIAYLYMTQKNQAYMFSTVKDMEMALEMYENDWRNEDGRSSYASVAYKLADLQKHETYLLSLMKTAPKKELGFPI
jgi:hypothetical protein